MPEQLKQHYQRLKALGKKNLLSPDLPLLIAEMARHSRAMLGECDRVELNAKNGKRYFGFRYNSESRPINEALYIQGEEEFIALASAFWGNGVIDAIDSTRVVYSIAYSVFAANDVHGVGRKASATFFEVLIGHMMARAVGVSPRKNVRIPESGAELPTDYVFDPGPNSRKVHLPIKTSTRERAVQAWVHQLVLDKIFGNGLYRGVLVVASETKRSTKTGEVVEICVPKQLQMFQTRVAEISRIYYLDPPQPYLALAEGFPRIDVRPFGAAFADIGLLLKT